MHPWSNAETSHNRYISTGPTPDGTIDDLIISIGYPTTDSQALYKAINIDNHIVPLIQRLPEMRHLLRVAAGHLLGARILAEAKGEEHYAATLERLIENIEHVIRPTDEELEHGTPG